MTESFKRGGYVSTRGHYELGERVHMIDLATGRTWCERPLVWVKDEEESDD